jgi:hypothetical protein
LKVSGEISTNAGSTIKVAQNATLNVSGGVLTINGTLDVSEGALTGSGTLTIGATATLDVGEYADTLYAGIDNITFDAFGVTFTGGDKTFTVLVGAKVVRTGTSAETMNGSLPSGYEWVAVDGAADTYELKANQST